MADIFYDENQEASLFDLYAVSRGSSHCVTDDDRTFELHLVRKADTPACIAGFNELHRRCMVALGTSVKLDRSFLFCESFGNLDEGQDGFADYWLFVKTIGSVITEGAKYINRQPSEINVEQFSFGFDVINKAKPEGSTDFNETIIGVMGVPQRTFRT
jgi:hypothetical protein